MGQAFRRAAGRIKPSSTIDSATSSFKMETTETVVDRKPPSLATDKAEILKSRQTAALDSEIETRSSSENVLEERDPQFDAMLGQMVGRIRSKPGGKLEMGEASVVERYDRPMPKLRNINQKTSRYEDRPAQAGTLKVAQMRQVLLLHEGKAEGHDGPMNIHQIAEKFKVSEAHIQTILKFLSLPPEDPLKGKNHNDNTK